MDTLKKKTDRVYTEDTFLHGSTGRVHSLLVHV